MDESIDHQANQKSNPDNWDNERSISPFEVKSKTTIFMWISETNRKDYDFKLKSPIDLNIRFRGYTKNGWS